MYITYIEKIARPEVSQNNIDEVKILSGKVSGSFDDALTELIKKFKKSIKNDENQFHSRIKTTEKYSLHNRRLDKVREKRG